jgi:hypothetical protein
MSDTNDEIAELGQQALQTGRVDRLRRQINSFVDAHDCENKLQELRSGVDSMSELVEAGRTE